MKKNKINKLLFFICLSITVLITFIGLSIIFTYRNKINNTTDYINLSIAGSNKTIVIPTIISLSLLICIFTFIFSFLYYKSINNHKYKFVYKHWLCSTLTLTIQILLTIICSIIIWLIPINIYSQNNINYESIVHLRINLLAILTCVIFALCFIFQLLSWIYIKYKIEYYNTYNN